MGDLRPPAPHLFEVPTKAYGTPLLADEQMDTGLTHAIPGQERLYNQSRDTFKSQAGMCDSVHSLLGFLSPCL